MRTILDNIMNECIHKYTHECIHKCTHECIHKYTQLKFTLNYYLHSSVMPIHGYTHECIQLWFRTFAKSSLTPYNECKRNL